MDTVCFGMSRDPLLIVEAPTRPLEASLYTLAVLIRMGSSLNLGPFWGPFYQGAVLYWGPKKGPYFAELPKKTKIVL